MEKYWKWLGVLLYFWLKPIYFHGIIIFVSDYGPLPGRRCSKLTMLMVMNLYSAFSILHNYLTALYK